MNVGVAQLHVHEKKYYALAQFFNINYYYLAGYLFMLFVMQI